MSMQDVLLALVDSCGYWGIFLLILIENVFPPIPSEAVLLFGGALTVTTAMNVPGTILAATAGSVLGAMVGAKGLPQKWIAPLNDTLHTGVDGYNKVSISGMAKKTLEYLP
mgnify:CR=1 FL=1